MIKQKLLVANSSEASITYPLSINLNALGTAPDAGMQQGCMIYFAAGAAQGFDKKHINIKTGGIKNGRPF